MAITPDLKKDEIEFSILCPHGACLVQTTYAFSRDLLNQNSKIIKQMKSNIMDLNRKAHNDGKHRPPKAVA